MAKRTTKTTKKATPVTVTALHRQCYDILVASFNPKSKFYSQDCDELWAGLLSRSQEQLLETLQRQRAIARTTQREMNLHCQFEGMM